MEILWSIIVWAVFGLVIGAIARLLYPGRQPMSLLMTMALGIVGSFVGGLVSWALGFSPEDGPFNGAGWIMSILGALLVTFLGLYLASKSRTTDSTGVQGRPL
ncbi:MAG: GlsB/YeaQ/YmgE family stress response membrane protein [Pirellulaceae bacterium]